MASTALALPRIIEILGPDGEYEKKRLALRGEYGQVVLAARALTVISSGEQAQEAANFGRLLQAATKETEAFYKSVKSQIDDIKKPVLQAEKDDTASYNTEKSRLGGLVQSYQQEVERQRREDERIAREAAEAQAREEVLQRAIELEEAGEGEAAQQLLEEPIIAPPVVLLSPAPSKPTGSVTRTIYSAEVTNFKELVEAVASGKVPLMALLPNDQFLNQQAKSFKEGFSMPGVKLKTDTSTGFRS
jgi:hypothetical protein